MNKELNDALQYDPLAQAEKICGKSYKEDESVAWLGMAMQMEHNDRISALLKQNRDTCYRNTLEEQIAVFEDMGFRLLICEPIEGTKDKWRIFWRAGVLLFCDSYSGDKSLNSGKIYFNYCGPREAMIQCSNGYAGKVDGENVYSGSKDVREGLRHCLDTMTESGKLLEKWVEKPFLWLLHYMDTKIEGYDYNEINSERIAMLPDDVREAIGA